MNEKPDNLELLCDYLDGALDEPRRAEVERLLANDAEMRKLLAQARQAQEAMRSLPADVAPEALKQQIAADIASHEIGDSRWSAGRLARIAAALFVAVALGIVIWSILPGRGVEPRAAQYATDAQPRAEKQYAEEGRKNAEPLASKAMPDTGERATQFAGANDNDKERQFAADRRDVAAREVSANVEATVVVRGGDIPTLRRDIYALARANGMQTPKLEAKDMSEARERDAAAVGRVATAGPAEAPASVSARPSASPSALGSRRLASTSAAPMAAPESALARADAKTSEKADEGVEVVVLRNANASQLESVRTGIVELAKNRKAQVVDMALADGQILSVNQVQNSQMQGMIPSAGSQAVDSAQNQTWRNQQQMVNATPRQLYDVTVILERSAAPAAEPLDVPATGPTPAPVK